MGADANIFQQYAQPVRSASDYAGDMDLRDLRRAQLQGATQNNALQALTMDQTRQTMAATDRKRLKIQQAVDAAGPNADPMQLARRLQQDGDTMAEGVAWEKHLVDTGKVKADTAKATADAGKTVGDTADASIKRYRGALDFIDTPEGARRWLAAQYQDPALSSHMQAMGPIEAAVQRIPTDPQGFQQWRQQAGMGMDAYQRHLQEQAKIAETERNNRSGTATTIRGQDIVAGTAAAGRAQAERHFNITQAAPKYMETDAGLVALPQNPAPGQTPAGVAVNGPDGQPLGKPLKALPPAVNDAIIGNAQSLYSLDKAIALLQGKTVGSAAGDKAATGWKGYLPQAILNRVDPSGVDTRAEVADIGSLKIHDRSGAAVTISESPRLMPFIPSSTDPADVAVRKLTRLKEEAQRNQQALSDTYSKEQGYKPSPVKPAASGPAGGNSVTTPDGKVHTFPTAEAAAKFKKAAGL